MTTFCRDCNISLTDDIKYSNNYCFPCQEKIIYQEYIDFQIENGILKKCENCGSIWSGTGSCMCIDYESENEIIYSDNDTDSELDTEYSFEYLNLSPTDVSVINNLD